MIEVSVVIPTYNRKEFLRECLQSLFLQIYPKDAYEVIVVDDGSSDGTSKLLVTMEKQQGSNMICLRQERGGMAKARNLGVKYAKGDIIAFLDDDCIADKNWIKEIISFSRCHPEADVWGSGAYNDFFDADKGYSTIIIYNLHREKLNNNLNKQNKSLRMFSPVAIITNNYAIRKRVFLKTGGFDERFKCGEDSELNTRLLKSGNRFFLCNAMLVRHKVTINLRENIKKAFRKGIGDHAVLRKHFEKKIVFGYYHGLSRYHFAVPFPAGLYFIFTQIDAFLLAVIVSLLFYPGLLIFMVLWLFYHIFYHRRNFKSIKYIFPHFSFSLLNHFTEHAGFFTGYFVDQPKEYYVKKVF